MLFAATYRGTTELSYPVLAFGVMLVGAGLVASRFVRNRTVFSAVGVGLLLWAGYAPLHRAVLGDAHGGGIFYLFVDGILLISGALLVIAFNGPGLARGIERVVTGRLGATPVTRVARLSGRAYRTSITLTIFALVPSLSSPATYSSTLTEPQRLHGRPIRGYTSSVAPRNRSRLGTVKLTEPEPIPNGAAGHGRSLLRWRVREPVHQQVFAADPNASAGSSFYSTNQSLRFDGLSDGGAVWMPFDQNGSVAVGMALCVRGGFTAAPHPWPTWGCGPGVQPGTGAARNVTVTVF